MRNFKIILIICLILCLIPVIINFTVILMTKKRVYKNNEIDKTYDMALVLGCSVLDNKTPSKMLKDRLDMVIRLYEEKRVNQIIVSGDDREDYSEVTVMYNYLVEHNIKEDDIIIDNIGYSTGESIENLQKNYPTQETIIVTQRYHLYRALYIAKKLNLKTIGVMAEEKNYPGDFHREVREILARNKDFVKYF